MISSVRNIIFTLFISFSFLSLMTGIANAQTYTKTLGTWDLGNSSNASPISSDIMGYNITHGFAMPIEHYLWADEINRNKDIFEMYIRYTLPDDGSRWVVKGNVMFSTGTNTRQKNYQISETHNTPGTFTGVSIGRAVNAANDAKSSADAAKNAASTASSRVWDSTESKSAATLAKEARDKAVELETEINNLKTVINNFSGEDITPPSVKVETVSGARATSSNSIKVLVLVTDAQPGPFQYSIDDGSYAVLPSDGVISLPVSNYGNNRSKINVKDAAGNIGKDTIMIRRL